MDSALGEVDATLYTPQQGSDIARLIGRVIELSPMKFIIQVDEKGPLEP